MEPTVTISKVEADIIDLQRKWMDACLRKNATICDEILSDDFILHSARGMAKTKAEWMNDLNHPMTKLTELKFEKEPQARDFGKVCVVKSIIRQEGIWGEGDFSGEFYLLDVWINQNNKWQLWARQGTRKT